MTREVARLIHKHDDLETQVNVLEGTANSVSDPHRLLPDLRIQLHGMRARLAAQGFFMSPREANIGE